MGSGASQEVSTKVKDQSAEDLEKLFKELPSDEISKILQAAQAAKGDVGGSESSAPFLRKAFKMMSDVLVKMMEAEENDEEQPEMDVDKLKAEYDELIKKSFDHHDRKKAGKLDKDDAAIFFKNFMQESMVFMEATTANAHKLHMDKFKKELEEEVMSAKDEFPTAKDHLPGALKAAKAEMNKVLLLLKAKAKGNADAFAANRDALTCAAFVQIDDDGDGSLTIKEFEEMMDMGSDKHEELTKMLVGGELESALQDPEIQKALGASKDAAGMYMKEKLGIKDD